MKCKRRNSTIVRKCTQIVDSTKAYDVRRNIARIIWGDPVFYDGLIQDIDEGRVHIGGCCVTGDDPEWHCNDCEEEF